MGESIDPYVGSRLAGYEIRGVLHEGDASTLYEAEQVDLGRRAVVKVVSARRLGDDETIERFLREARTLAALRHENLVMVYDLGRLDDGRPYTVMERLEGQTLAEVLENEREVPLERIVTIVDAVAAALGALRQRGIVHRNVKPENVFVTGGGGNESIKLIDFGTVAAPPGRAGRRLTRVGEALGTPHYMAPESLGEAPLDARADVYALATMAYELISGVTPFDADDPLALLALKAAKDAPPLSEKLDVAPPAELERALLRGLARDREARTNTAEQLAAEVRAGIAAWGTPAGPRSVRPPARASKIPPPAEAPAEDASPSATRDEARTGPRPRATTGDLPTVPTHSRQHVWVAVAVLVAAGATALLIGSNDDGGGGHAASAEERSEPTPRAGSSAPALPSPEPPAPVAQEDPVPEGRETPVRRSRRARISAADPPAAGEPVVPTVPEEDRRAAREATERGTQALVRGRIPEAIRHFRDATLRDPRHAAAWRGLGLANERLGRIPEAVEAYDQYLAFAPSAGDAAVVRERLAALQR